MTLIYVIEFGLVDRLKGKQQVLSHGNRNKRYSSNKKHLRET